jgi:hypothetical protein
MNTVKTAKNIEVKNWFIGLTIDDMLVVMSRLAHDSVACMVQGEEKESENKWDIFMAYFEEVIPAIVEEKTWYWAVNKEAWKKWDDFQRELWSIRRNMENGIYSLVTKGTL